MRAPRPREEGDTAVETAWYKLRYASEDRASRGRIEPTPTIVFGQERVRSIPKS
jgi:hypothetical protein